MACPVLDACVLRLSDAAVCLAWSLGSYVRDSEGDLALVLRAFQTLEERGLIIPVYLCLLHGADVHRQTTEAGVVRGLEGLRDWNRGGRSLGGVWLIT